MLECHNICHGWLLVLFVLVAPLHTCVFDITQLRNNGMMKPYLLLDGNNAGRKLIKQTQPSSLEEFGPNSTTLRRLGDVWVDVQILVPPGISIPGNSYILLQVKQGTTLVANSSHSYGVIFYPMRLFAWFSLQAVRQMLTCVVVIKKIAHTSICILYGALMDQCLKFFIELVTLNAPKAALNCSNTAIGSSSSAMPIGFQTDVKSIFLWRPSATYL